MNEMYELLKQKLQTMKDIKSNSVSFDYCEVAKMYQLICLMKQIKQITDWGEQ